jgi:hypothetical protein
MNQQLVSLLRYGLMIIGTWLASSGTITEGDWESVSGALLTLISVGWAVWAKVGTTRVPVDTLTTKQTAITGVSPKV